MNKLSKVLCFTLFSVLLTSGFPNFMMQEAHAAAATFSSLHTGDTAGNSDATTTLDLVFNQKVYVTDAAGANVVGTGINVDIQNRLKLNGGAFGDGIASAIVKENDGVTPNDGACDADAATIVITLDTAISRGATPTIEYDEDAALGASTRLLTCDGAATAVGDIAAQTATDGLRPIRNTSVTPTTTNTEIKLTFVENMAKGSAFSNSHFGVSVVGSFVTFTVSNVAISGKTVTLTVPTLPPTSTVSVTFSGTANSIEDTAGNDLAAISAFTFTSNSQISGGCNGDCTPPTLGIDYSGNRVVTDGFTYNGHAVDVEKFFTPYPLITANVGKTNTAQFKIYENMGPQNIRHFTFAFGLDKSDVVSQSKAKVELDIAFDGTQTVTLTDPENALDNIKINTSNISCMNDSPNQCLEVEIIHTFRQPLDFNIVATDVWDQSRNAWQNYYNHGIHVVGDSLNPPKEYDAVHKGKIFHLTQIDKLTAVDENGEFWTLEYGKWSKDYIKPEIASDLPVNVMTRKHSEFGKLVQMEIDIATEKLLDFCPNCHDSWQD